MEKRRLILLIIVILTIAFIFGQSFLNQEMSKKESTVVQEKIVEPVYKAITGEETIPHDVRDSAHIFEFAVLGVELVFLLRDKKWFLRGLRAVSSCGLAALLDESIQFLSDRTPQVVDIWGDILGGTIGAVLGLLLILVIGKSAEKRRAER